MTVPSLFGSFEGADIHEVTLRSDAGAKAKIITWGAVLRDFHVPSKAGFQRVVLGYDKFEDYPAHSPYFGANPGPVANRIGNGRFEIEGVVYEVERNQHGKHTLHGASRGYGVRPWSILSLDGRSVTLGLVSEDGEGGFPGHRVVICIYRLLEPATVSVEFTVTTDKATPVGLAHHSYFNLDGSPDVLDHHLMLAADFYTPTDADLIPTGEIRSVEGTPYDFRAERTIRGTMPDGWAGYDINLVLRSVGDLAHAATAFSPKSGVTMEVWTTEPGVQFYDAAKLDSPVLGLGGARYGSHAGFCLEAQNFPDAVNRPHFPDAILWPGEVYSQVTEYRFGQR